MNQHHRTKQTLTLSSSQRSLAALLLALVVLFSLGVAGSLAAPALDDGTPPTSASPEPVEAVRCRRPGGPAATCAARRQRGGDAAARSHRIGLQARATWAGHGKPGGRACLESRPVRPGGGGNRRHARHVRLAVRPHRARLEHPVVPGLRRHPVLPPRDRHAGRQRHSGVQPLGRPGGQRGELPAGQRPVLGSGGAGRRRLHLAVSPHRQEHHPAGDQGLRSPRTRPTRRPGASLPRTRTSATSCTGRSSRSAIASTTST